jgi:hypothetical protein
MTGNWDEQDPAGYVDGADIYQTELSDPINPLDPYGTVWQLGTTPLTLAQATKILQDQVIMWESGGDDLPGDMLNQFLYGHGAPYALTSQDVNEAIGDGIMQPVFADIDHHNEPQPGLTVGVRNSLSHYFDPTSGDLFWAFASLFFTYHGTIAWNTGVGYCYNLRVNVSKNYNFNVKNSAGVGSKTAYDAAFEVFEAGAILELAQRDFPFNISGSWTSKGHHMLDAGQLVI